MNRRASFAIASLLTLLMAACASQAPVPDLTEITVYNTGTLRMLPPEACYYGDNQAKQCQKLDTTLKGIEPGASYNFFIQANQKIRLVFPFDEMQRVGGVMYRPNCHILVDFFVYQEKRYHAQAEIRAPQNDPEKGFNCALHMQEQTLGSSTKTDMNEQAFTKIRYRVPRKGETPAGYVSNYDWQ